MAKIGDVGTLRELDVNPGDVVEYIDTGAKQTVVGTDHNGRFVGDRCIEGESWLSERNCWRLVSRAQPTIWRDMTPEEKGALLLAAHEGKAIEFMNDFDTPEWKKAAPKWASWCYYRVKPEPVRETVSGWWNGKNFHNTANYVDRTHRITFDTIDGKPDCNSVKMEAI